MRVKTEMIACVVFDFDGTLVRSNAVKRQSLYDAVANVAGATEALDGILRRPRLGDRYQIFAALAAELAADGAAVDWVARYTRLCERISRCPEVPRATAALRRLSQTGVTLYLNSGTPRLALQPIAQARGFARYLNGILGAPESKSVRSPCSRSAIRAAAVEVGCRFIAVRNADNDFKAPPEMFVDDLADICDLITQRP